jgi:hypothetical protein
VQSRELSSSCIHGGAAALVLIAAQQQEKVTEFMFPQSTSPNFQSGVCSTTDVMLTLPVQSAHLLSCVYPLLRQPTPP